MQSHERIIVALDVPNFMLASEWVGKLRKHVGGFKVGKQLYTAVGPKMVEYIRAQGGEVFLDLKYHDVPRTVAKAAQSAYGLNVAMFNLHIGGGKEMMEKTMEALPPTDRPKVLGVTVLTSLNAQQYGETLGIPEGTLGLNMEKLVVHRAKLAQSCGLDGVIASAQEIRAIRKACGWEFITVVPGTRSLGKEVYDQKRVDTPERAIAGGADYLVVGSQILDSQDPLAEVEAIVYEIQKGMRIRVARRLREIKAVDFNLQEPWKVKAHKQYPQAPKSPFYIDQRIIGSYPRFASDVVDLYVALLERTGERPDLLCGVPTAATPIVSLMSDRTGIPMISPRMDVKTHGMERAIDGVYQLNQTVVLIDDLRTTGGSKKEVLNILRNAGLRVLRIEALIDRSIEANYIDGVAFFAEYQWNELLELYKAEGVVSEEEYVASLRYPEDLASYIKAA